jgi:hypothetical protein
MKIRRRIGYFSSTFINSLGTLIAIMSIAYSTMLQGLSFQVLFSLAGAIPILQLPQTSMPVDTWNFRSGAISTQATASMAPLHLQKRAKASFTSTQVAGVIIAALTLAMLAFVIVLGIFCFRWRKKTSLNEIAFRFGGARRPSSNGSDKHLMTNMAADPRDLEVTPTSAVCIPAEERTWPKFTPIPPTSDVSSPQGHVKGHSRSSLSRESLNSKSNEQSRLQTYSRGSPTPPPRMPLPPLPFTSSRVIGLQSPPRISSSANDEVRGSWNQTPVTSPKSVYSSPHERVNTPTPLPPLLRQSPRRKRPSDAWFDEHGNRTAEITLNIGGPLPTVMESPQPPPRFDLPELRMSSCSNSNSNSNRNSVTNLAGKQLHAYSIFPRPSSLATSCRSSIITNSQSGCDSRPESPSSIFNAPFMQMTTATATAAASLAAPFKDLPALPEPQKRQPSPSGAFGGRLQKSKQPAFAPTPLSETFRSRSSPPPPPPPPLLAPLSPLLGEIVLGRDMRGEPDDPLILGSSPRASGGFTGSERSYGKARRQPGGPARWARDDL